MGASREKKESARAGSIADAPMRASVAARTRNPAPANKPTTVAQCMHGGWKDFGFHDYGGCIVFVLSRPPVSGKA